MIAYQSRRLTGLLGRPLNQLKGEDVVAAVSTGTLREDEDLDFKEKSYAVEKADEAKRELAKDIASFANAQGGLIIIGIAEAKGLATSAAPLDCSDAVIRDLRSSVAGYVAPTPYFSIDPVPFASRQNEGFIFVSVPRSNEAPHAIRWDRDITLRYPRRVGTTTVFLSESQIADAYRSRFATAREQLANLDEVESEGISRLLPEKGWLHLSITPNNSATISLTAPALNSYREWARNIPSPLPESGPFKNYPIATTTRARRIVLISGSEHAVHAHHVDSPYCELHTNGSGFAALPLYNIERKYSLGFLGEVIAHGPISAEDLVLDLSVILTLLADHAVTHGGVTGDAVARLSIFNPQIDIPGSNSKLAPSVSLAIHEEGNRDSTRQIAIFPSSEHTISLSSALQPGTEHLLTLRLLLTDLFQSFGVIEVPQIDGQGQLRRRYWSDKHIGKLSEWSRSAGVRISGKPLGGD